MKTKNNTAYLENRSWLDDVMKEEDVILCYTSALEYLQLFLGYGQEEKIDVYALKNGKYENVNYRVVDSYDGIETANIGKVSCTSLDQTINDMLHDFDNIDEQSLVEALSNYYFTHDKSFSGLCIVPEKQKIFDSIKDWAIEYHEEG